MYQDFLERKEDLEFRRASFIHYNEDKFMRMVMFIGDRIFVYKIGKKEIKLLHTIELDHYIISINLVDQSWIYTIQECVNDRSEGGCYVYDMVRLVKYNKIN